MTVALATAWNPRGELPRFQRYYNQISELYTHLSISVRNGSRDNVFPTLDSYENVTYVTFEGYSGRHIVLKDALSSNPDFVHYVDMDRLIRWVETRPDELAATIEAIQQTDCLIIGRTDAAYHTHPDALRETEMLPNRFFSYFFERPMDFCAGSKGFSRAAANFILDSSSSDNSLRMDVEWPILLKRAGFRWRYVEVDGLDWESADQYQEVAAGREQQQELADAYDQDPKSWKSRTEVAHEITRLGLAALQSEPRKDT